MQSAKDPAKASPSQGIRKSQTWKGSDTLLNMMSPSSMLKEVTMLMGATRKIVFSSQQTQILFLVTKLALQNCSCVESSAKNRLQSGFKTLQLKSDDLKELQMLLQPESQAQKGKWSKIFSQSLKKTFANIDAIPELELDSYGWKDRVETLHQLVSLTDNARMRERLQVVLLHLPFVIPYDPDNTASVVDYVNLLKQATAEFENSQVNYNKWETVLKRKLPVRVLKTFFANEDSRILDLFASDSLGQKLGPIVLEAILNLADERDEVLHVDTVFSAVRFCAICQYRISRRNTLKPTLFSIVRLMPHHFNRIFENLHDKLVFLRKRCKEDPSRKVDCVVLEDAMVYALFKYINVLLYKADVRTWHRILAAIDFLVLIVAEPSVKIFLLRQWSRWCIFSQTSLALSHKLDLISASLGINESEELEFPNSYSKLTKSTISLFNSVVLNPAEVPGITEAVHFWRKHCSLASSGLLEFHSEEKELASFIVNDVDQNDPITSLVWLKEDSSNSTSFHGGDLFCCGNIRSRFGSFYKTFLVDEREVNLLEESADAEVETLPDASSPAETAAIVKSLVCEALQMHPEVPTAAQLMHHQVEAPKETDAVVSVPNAMSELVDISAKPSESSLDEQEDILPALKPLLMESVAKSLSRSSSPMDWETASVSSQGDISLEALFGSCSLMASSPLQMMEVCESSSDDDWKSAVSCLRDGDSPPSGAGLAPQMHQQAALFEFGACDQEEMEVDPPRSAPLSNGIMTRSRAEIAGKKFQLMALSRKPGAKWSCSKGDPTAASRLKKRRLLEPLAPLSSGEEPMEVDFPPEEPTKELLVAPKAAVELHQQTAAPEMLLKRCEIRLKRLHADVVAAATGPPAKRRKRNDVVLPPRDVTRRQAAARAEFRIKECLARNGNVEAYDEKIKKAKVVELNKRGLPLRAAAKEADVKTKNVIRGRC